MTKNGGWYLNGTTLEYREFKKDSSGNYIIPSELSTTVLAKISGLSASNIINGTGNQAGKIQVYAGNTWRDFDAANDVKFVEETTDSDTGKVTGKIEIASAILPKQPNKAITVTGSTNYDYTIKLDTNDQVRLSETDTVTHGTNGTTTITGNLTAGYTIATNGKSATYYAERTKQKLATITGLAKNYTPSTLALTAAYKASTVVGTGVITLSKLEAGSTDTSALGTTAITLTMDNVAVANGISYQLKLNEGSGTYKQVAANDEAAYWTVSGTKATYQYYSPTGYELTNAKNEVIATDGKVYKADGTAYEDDQGDSNATKIKVTAAKTTTIATVTGLANDITTNITDEKVETAKTTPTTSIADKVGIGQARFGEDGKDTNGEAIDDGSINPNQFVSGITVTTNVSNEETENNKPVYSADGKTTTKGNVAIQITKAVLPTKGNVVVTPGKDFNVTATTGDDFYNSEGNEVKKQRIWVINGNTAVYKEVDLAYYTSSTADGKTTIKCTPQTTGTVLATIKGLNAAWLADESHLTRNTKDTSGVITHIDGINITTAAGYNYDDKGKMTAKSGEVGEITLAKEVLDGMNVTITKSDNFKLALQNGDVTSVDDTNDKTTTTDVVLPAFNNYKWNLSGTTATLKGDIATAGYTLSDDSKTVTYTAAARNQTLATVSGLKKGTQLERETEGTTESGNTDYRRIGNYVGTTFTDGLAIDTSGTLSHKDDDDDKTLNRLPITISRLVMDTSKISLTSNFFTLELNKNKTDAEATDSISDVDSRVYVLEKSDLYDTAEDGTETVNTNLDKTVGWHGSLGSTAILKQALPAYYTTVADSAGTIKTINYTKPGDAKTLATVKGLNSAINENDIEFNATAKTIKIKSVDALTTGNVTITGTEGYTLALDVNKVGEAKLSNETWEQTGTTVNYTALVTSPGYKLNADKNLITYTKEATTTPTTLATITGLRAGLTKVDPSTTNDSSGNDGDGSTNPDNAAETDQTARARQYSGVTFDNKTGTITIGKEALNGSNIAIKGSANYKLALAGDLNKTTAPAPAKRWVISGTTATYKVVTPDYYTYNASNNTITYTKAVDAKYQNDTTNDTTRADYSSDESLKGKTIPALVSISGLKSGLVVNDEGDKIGYYKADGTFFENAITFGTDNDDKKITINDAGVLNGTTVKIDNTAHTNGYRIELSSDLVDDVKPQLEGDATWTISRGTATLKGNVAAGYSNNSNGTQIDFSAAKNGATIATITGLKNTATTTDGLTLGTTAGTNDHIITVANDMLSTSNVKLTTNIAILGKPYQLALDAETKQKDNVTSTEQNRWSIDKTTATYYTWRDTYYSLNNGQDGASDTITYHAAGEGLKTGEDVLATVTGLASGLVTIQDDQIRGITVGKEETETVDGKQVTTFTKAEDGTIIQLSSNVLPTKVKDEVKVTSVADGKRYTLRLDADDTSIPTPKADVYYTIQTTADVANVTIKNAKTAGFEYKTSNNTPDNTTLVYSEETPVGDGSIGTIKGLAKTITLNANNKIDGIQVNDASDTENPRTIFLSKAVLNGAVTFTTTNTTNPYKVKLGSDVTGANSDPILEKTATTGTFALRTGVTSGGYDDSSDATTENGVVTQKITYLEGGNTGSIVATITGLKNIDKDKVAVTEVKDGDEVTGYNITISSADALNAQDVTVTPSDSTSTKTYTLELNGVAASEATDTWDLTNGTATFTHKVTAGYKVDSATGKIVYTPESSIVSTLNNLSKENLKVSEDKTKLYVGNDESTTAAIEFDSTNNKFIVNSEDALAHKAVKLTTRATGKDSSGKNVTANYTVDLDSDIKAKTDPAVWNKADNATVATLTETTASGYSISGDQQNITYSSDPVVTTLATVNGLNKDSVAYTEGNKSYVGIGVTNSSTTPATTTYTKGLEVTTEPSGSTTGTITIGQNVLNNAKVTLTSTKYVLALDKTTSPVVDSDVAEKKVWAISGTTATYKNVKPAYYTLDANSKGLTYTAQKDTNVRETNSPNVTVIKGLKSGLKLNEEGKVINADGTTTDGLTVDTDSGKVVLTSAVLGTNKEITSDQYTLELSSSDTSILKESQSNLWENQTEWVGSGTTYTLKKYNKAYFKYETGNKKITYTAPTAGTTYATISNLASDATITFDATESDNLAKGGTIKISAYQLIDKDVTLKVNSGTFALAFADNFDAGKKSSIDSSTLKWGKTNATTAVLQGTKTAGYTLSEDAKSITYKKTDGTVTLATISGLKSGFELPASTTFTTDSSGNQIITLDKTMLGTANVTLKGDGYKLKLAKDVASETDKATWVKAANATKATFTQQTYNGFTESADGKSLTYIKTTSKIDLATINGLSKDLTTDNMKVVYADGSKTADEAKTEATDAISKDGTLVVLDDVNKVIYLKQDALSGKVTLANKDGYTFALVNDSNASVTELGGTKITDAAPKVTFNNGTMSIVAGTDDKWVLSDDKKTLNYTAAKYDTLATVSGLPKTITNTAHEGITVDDTIIKIDEKALVSTDATTKKATSLLANNAKIVLTNKKVGEKTYTYAIKLGDGLNAKTTAPDADKKVWALSGTNLSLKEVTSAYYLTPEASGTTQTITYVAEKVGNEIAKIAGLPSGVVKQSSDGQTVYVGDNNTSGSQAFIATMSGDGAMDAKTIEVGSALRTAISTADKAVTLTLTGNGGYTFSNYNAGTAPKQTDFGFILDKSFTALSSAGKATVIKEVEGGWTSESTNTKLIFAKSADSVVATITGINKAYDKGDKNNLAFNEGTKTVTVGAPALNKTNVTLAIPSKGEVYNLALASNVASSLRSLDDTPAASDVANWTGGWMNQTDWVVSGGTASYKTYNKANYYIKPSTNASTPNSIAYNAPTAGTTYARITGLNKTAESVDSSVALSAYSSTVDAGKDIIITLGAKELGTSKVTLAVSKANTVATATTASDIVAAINTDLNAKIADGNMVAPNFKLALDTTSDSGVTLSDVKNAVWDTNGTVANLTGTITKGYKLSNDQKSITYQAADSKLQVIAKVSGIKKDSQISDSLVAAITNTTDPNYNAALPNLQYITLNKEHLGTSNVMLTGEGYKLKLGTDVVLDTNSISGAENGWHDQTEWVANNGTFTYKTYDKANYKVNDTGMQVIYTAAKDDTKNNANHKTFVQITGLSKTAEASALKAAGIVGSNTADSVTTINVTTANEGVISLGADVLTTGTIKLTDNMISASLNGAPVLYNGGYTLALEDDVKKSTASNVNATVSGTKATWAGTQGAGYLLANDEQNVTYYSAKKDKQTIATVTGLNASVTAENSNDSLSSSYDADTNVMTLTKDKLSTNVGISGTVAYNFSDFDSGTITGSGSADKVSIGGESVSINAGNGNDIINFTKSSRAGNTFIYANGNGNDVIYGFTSNDVIKVTNVVGTTSTTKKVKDASSGEETEVTTYKNNIEVYADTKISGDTLVKVNNNVIRLKSYSGTVTVHDNKDNPWTTSWTHEGTPNGSFIGPDPSNVLADDDYAMTPQNASADEDYAMSPNLSSIVKSSTSSYMADDLVADDATALTKQSTAVSYSDKK